jgi:hypothetical protein
MHDGIHQELNAPEVREGARQIAIGFAEGFAQGTPTSPFTTTFAVASFILAALLCIAIGAVISLSSRVRLSGKVIALLAQRLGDAPSAGATEDAVKDARARS